MWTSGDHKLVTRVFRLILVLPTWNEWTSNTRRTWRATIYGLSEDHNSPSELAYRITFLTYLFRLHRFCNNGFHVRKADLNRIILASFLFGPWPLARSTAAPAPFRHEWKTINEWANPACRNASLCMLAIIDLVLWTSEVDLSLIRNLIHHFL